LDGTVLGTDFALPELTATVIQAVQQGGTQVIIATGRTFRSARPVARSMSIAGPIVTHQGAQVREVESGDALYSTTIPLVAAREVLAELEHEEVTTTVYLDDVIYVAHLTPQLERYRANSGVDMRVVGALATGLEAAPTKIVVNAEATLLDEVQRRLRARFDGRLTVAKSWPIFLEVAAHGVSKAAALRFLAERDGFAAADAIAFGDSAIDIDMLEWAGMGVAVAGAPDEVKRVADRICGPVADQGVAHFLLDLAGIDHPTCGHA
jgi:Cof subfamily protein (haloacid dehalogenase superfamily)